MKLKNMLMYVLDLKRGVIIENNESTFDMEQVFFLACSIYKRKIKHRLCPDLYFWGMGVFERLSGCYRT